MASIARSATPAFPPKTEVAGSRRRFEWLARVARERLVQFVVLGGAIFFASSRLHRDGERIAFTAAQLGLLRDAEAQRRGLDPSGLTTEIEERALEDEILYREGLKLGFDKDDAIVKQRVIQKTLFLAEELAGASEPPTEGQLREYFESVPGEWRRPERWRFMHAFARERAAMEDLRARAVGGESVERLGDPCPVPREASMTSEQLVSSLGSEFVASLRTLPVDSFGPPVRSALGWHVVRVLEHVDEAPATFEEAKGALRGAYVVKRREQAVAAFLDKAFRQYTVTIDGRRVDAIEPSGRVAIRTSDSAED